MSDAYSHRDKCAIVGIGATDFSRDSGRTETHDGVEYLTFPLWRDTSE